MHRIMITMVSLLPLAAVHAADEAQCPDCPAAIAIEAAYTGEMWRQVSGGFGVDNRYLDNIDFTADIDGELAFGIAGLELYGALLYNNGRALAADLSGSVHGVSNIETTEGVRLFELWTQWSWSGDASVRFGLYDLNSEFDAIETASLFINPSHGIGPDFAQSGEGGPSIFPVSALAVRAQKNAGPWSLQAAVFDGRPQDGEYLARERFAVSSGDGVLGVGELNYRWDSGLRIGGGYWRYSAAFDDLLAVDGSGNPRRRHDNAGAYLLLETPMLLEDGRGRGLNLYVRTGGAESHINPIVRYHGAGAVYSGFLFPDRHDQIGVAVALAQAGGPWRRLEQSLGGAPARGEYNYELTYGFAVTQGLTLQFDVQRIENPGMNSTLDSVWVVGLRVIAAQGWSR